MSKPWDCFLILCFWGSIIPVPKQEPSENCRKDFRQIWSKNVYKVKMWRKNAIGILYNLLSKIHKQKMQKSEFSPKFRMQRYTFILLIGNTSEYPLKMYFLSLHHKHDGSITRVYKQKLTHSLPGSVYKILVLWNHALNHYFPLLATP